MSDPSTAKRRGVDLAEFLRLTNSRPSDFLDHKLEDHCNFTIVMLWVFGPLALAMWFWDYVIDPVGAMSTIALRLVFSLVGFVPAIIFSRVKSRIALQATVAAALVAASLIFTAIAARLDTGMVYGIGGYMFFAIAVILLCQGFSWEFGTGLAIMGGALPHILGLVGYVEGFPHLRYAVLIWPAIGMTCAAMVATSYNYGQRYDSQRQLEVLSSTDPLTEAANRRHFMPILEREIVRSVRYDHPLSLLTLDVDEFKAVNDHLGHHVGDLVLRQLADTCRASIRATDTLARLGGDEFALLLPETDIAGALELAETLRTAVKSTPPVGIDGETVSYAVSIGVTQARLGETTAFPMLRRADKALYEAKQSGRDRVHAVV